MRFLLRIVCITAFLAMTDAAFAQQQAEGQQPPSTDTASAPISNGEREILSWGSRAGYGSTVIAKSGLGTANAIIKTRFTDQDAWELCGFLLIQANKEDEPITESCIANARAFAARGEDILKADCTTGRFDSFNNKNLRYLGEGHNYKGDGAQDPGVYIYGAAYSIIKKEDGSIEEPIPNNEYAVDSVIFFELCPSGIRKVIP
ncbi:hypothetical protein [Labrys neptuniae]